MKKQIQTITEHESDLFLATVAQHGPTPTSQRRAVRDSCIVLLMLDAGLRVGEVVQLLHADLSYDGDSHTNLVIRASIAKRHVERIVPVTERLRRAIRNIWQYVWSEDGNCCELPAFYVAHGPNRISIRQVQRLIGNASRLAIGRTIHPHVLRHTFATRVMKQSDSRVVQQLLGHASLSTTQIYTHPDQQDRKNAIVKMESSTDAENNQTNENAQGNLEAAP